MNISNAYHDYGVTSSRNNSSPRPPQEQIASFGNLLDSITISAEAREKRKIPQTTNQPLSIPGDRAGLGAGFDVKSATKPEITMGFGELFGTPEKEKEKAEAAKEVLMKELHQGQDKPITELQADLVRKFKSTLQPQQEKPVDASANSGVDTGNNSKAVDGEDAKVAVNRKIDQVLLHAFFMSLQAGG